MSFLAVIFYSYLNVTGDMAAALNTVEGCSGLSLSPQGPALILTLSLPRSHSASVTLRKAMLCSALLGQAGGIQRLPPQGSTIEIA